MQVSKRLSPNRPELRYRDQGRSGSIYDPESEVMTMKYRVMVIAVLMGTLVWAGPAVGQDTAWSVEGEVVTADNCRIGCPCILGEAPHHGHCNFVGIFHVTKGRYGEVSLDGSEFGLAGEFVRDKGQADQTYTYVAYYIDSEADDSQREALRAILTGPAFAPLGEPAEVKDVAIQMEGMEHFGEVGKTYGGTIGDVATVMVTPIAGAMPGQPMVIENSAEPLFHWTCLGEATGSQYSAGGKQFVFEGTSGESHRFAFGSGH